MNILNALEKPSKHNRSYLLAGIAIMYTTCSSLLPSPVNYGNNYNNYNFIMIIIL